MDWGHVEGRRHGASFAPQSGLGGVGVCPARNAAMTGPRVRSLRASPKVHVAFGHVPTSADPVAEVPECQPPDGTAAMTWHDCLDVATNSPGREFWVGYGWRSEVLGVISPFDMHRMGYRYIGPAGLAAGEVLEVSGGETTNWPEARVSWRRLKLAIAGILRIYADKLAGEIRAETDEIQQGAKIIARLISLLPTTDLNAVDVALAWLARNVRNSPPLRSSVRDAMEADHAKQTTP